MLTPALAVSRALQKEIGGGRYEPGASLPALEDLANRFGISEACAAEAVAALAKAGFVEVAAGRTVVVSARPGPSSDAVLDEETCRRILDFLDAVEPAAAALAALTVSDADMLKLTNLHELMGGALLRNEWSSVTEIDVDFHVAIAEMAGNSVVIDTLRRELPQIMQVEEHLQNVLEGVRARIAEHEPILRALRLRDAGGAAEAMQAHVAEMASRLGIVLTKVEAAAQAAADESAGGIDETGLTPRELNCLKWYVAGKTAWETGQILHISEWTVVYHLNKLKRKWGVATNRQLVVKALSLGIVASE